MVSLPPLFIAVFLLLNLHQRLPMKQEIYIRMDAASESILFSLSKCEIKAMSNHGNHALFEYLWCTRNTESSKNNDYDLINNAITDDMVMYLAKKYNVELARLFDLKQYLVYMMADTKLWNPEHLQESTLVHLIADPKLWKPEYLYDFTISTYMSEYNAAMRLQKWLTTNSSDYLDRSRKDDAEVQSFGMNGINLANEKELMNRINISAEIVLATLTKCEIQTLTGVSRQFIHRWLTTRYSQFRSEGEIHKTINNTITDKMIIDLVKNYDIEQIAGGYNWIYEFRKNLVFTFVAGILWNHEQFVGFSISDFVEDFKSSRNRG